MRLLRFSWLFHCCLPDGAIPTNDLQKADIPKLDPDWGWRGSGNIAHSQKFAWLNTPSERMKLRSMRGKLLELGNAARAVIGIFTAINWGSSIAYIAGLWFGAH